MSKWELILQMKNYIRLMRVHHYIKNILVLTPLLFSGQLFDQKKIQDAMEKQMNIQENFQSYGK